MKKRPEELGYEFRTEGFKTKYWCKPLPGGSFYNLFFLLIIMEVHSSDDWREWFNQKEEILRETSGYHQETLREDNEEIYE